VSLHFLIADEEVYKTFLKPGEPAEAEFEMKTEKIVAREYCNIHGLWKNKL